MYRGQEGELYISRSTLHRGIGGVTPINLDLPRVRVRAHRGDCKLLPVRYDLQLTSRSESQKSMLLNFLEFFTISGCSEMEALGGAGVGYCDIWHRGCKLKFGVMGGLAVLVSAKSYRYLLWMRHTPLVMVEG